MALGATPLRVAAEAVTPSTAIVVSGIAAGLVAARVTSRLIAHLVWGVPVRDQVTFGIAGAMMLTIGVGASIAPGWLQPAAANVITSMSAVSA